MTLQEAAQQALDVQDACNLSGVLHSLDQIVSQILWPEARRIGKGTDWVNRHAIVSAFLYKLMDLNGGETDSGYIDALSACRRISQGEVSE